MKLINQNDDDEGQVQKRIRTNFSDADKEVLLSEYVKGTPVSEIQQLLSVPRSKQMIYAFANTHDAHRPNLKLPLQHPTSCRNCGIDFKIGGRHGWNSLCVRCGQENQRKVDKAHTKRMKYLALAMYSGEPPHCVCCNESNLTFLTIDHIAGGGRHEIRELGLDAGRKFYTWLIKQPFNPSKYRTLCYNCNYSYGIYGYCPHKGITP